MSKLQVFKEFLRERLTTGALEIFGAFEKYLAENEDEIHRTKEECARLQRLLDVVTHPDTTLHRTDVQLFCLQEPPQIEEKLWTNQEEEPLNDPTDSIFSSPCVKHHCDQDSYELPHLGITVKVERSEGDSLTTNTTEEQIKAEPDEKDCGAPEPASDSTPLSVVTPDCPTALSSEEESGGRLPVLQQTTELKSPNDARPKNNQQFKCPECSKCFVTARKLNRHVWSHTGEKPYQCQECDRNFRWRSELMNHMKKHSGEKPYQCQECNKAFSNKYHLVDHVRTHTGEKPFQCQECNKSFSQKSNLVKHKKTHTGERPHQCQECSRAFSEKSNLINHMKTHTGQKLHHVRRHTGETPLQCQECHTYFNQKSHLVEHARTQTGEKLYRCQECDSAFKYKMSLVKHTRLHTGENSFSSVSD